MLAKGNKFYLSSKKSTSRDIYYKTQFNALNNDFSLSIEPNKTLKNYSMYVTYDVINNGQIVIPRDTRVVGDWETENCPEPSAQFITKKIYLDSDPSDLYSTSKIFNAITLYNSEEIFNAPLLYKKNRFNSKVSASNKSMIPRRDVRIGLTLSKTLVDNFIDKVYLDIPTHEIEMTLRDNFVTY
jgi:hypothetical protein